MLIVLSVRFNHEGGRLGKVFWALYWLPKFECTQKDAPTRYLTVSRQAKTPNQLNPPISWITVDF